MYHVPLALLCIYGQSDEGGMGRREERRLPGLLYADGLVLYGELEENLRRMVGCFVEEYKRRGQKINEGKSKEMVLGGEEGLECEVCVNCYMFRACLRI